VGRLVEKGDWTLSEDGASWEHADAPAPSTGGGSSTNSENNDMDGFHYRPPETFEYQSVSLYDEITFLDLDGNELVKVVNPDSTKVNYPLNPQKKT